VLARTGPKHDFYVGQGLLSRRRLETMDLDGLGIQLQPFLLVHQELLYVFALVTLQLDHLAHLRVVHNGSIARELLLDHLEDLLLVKLLGQALDRGQGFATIALCYTGMLVRFWVGIHARRGLFASVGLRWHR
jgi:hypothetical protein